MILERFVGQARRLTIDAARLEIDETRRTVRATEIRGDLGNAGRSESLEVSAPRGSVDLSTGTARLEGGVQVHSESGRTLKTSAVVWRDSPPRMSSEGPIEVIGINFRGEGGRATHEIESRRVRIEGPVQFQIHSEPR